MSSIVLSSVPLTMTSREIAELTGKNHADVMRDIRNMVEQLTKAEMLSCAKSTTYTGKDGRQYPQYELDKDTCLTLLLGYDAVARMKVVKRWQELEAAQVPQVPQVPQTYAQALLEAGRLALQVEQQQEQLALAAPKVEFVDRYVSANGLKGFREVCKLLRVNEARFRDFLIERQIMYRLAGVLTAYQNHIDAGRFEVRTGLSDSDHAYTSTKFTAKGIDWIAGEWAKHQLHAEVVA